MTQDEIIKMAWDSGAYTHRITTWGFSLENLVIFADAIAAKEREACAKKCETVRETIWEYHEEHLKAAACNVCTNLAIAIRARGEA